jgi:glycosyltransferase involved in cell wall biosynthesis
MKPLYAMADVYLHTASYEGMPFSLLEAMSYKLPCAVSEELHKDLFFSEDVLYKGFEGLKLFVTSKELRMKAGDRAYEYMKENLSIEVIARSYLSLYKNSLSKVDGKGYQKR